jgi:hypothetical protein
VSTRDSSSAEFSERLTRVLEQLTEATLILTHAVAQAEPFDVVDPGADVELDPSVLMEVIHVQPRPGRASEPQRVILWLQQRGQAPQLPPCQMVATVPAGMAIPFEIGQRFYLTLRPGR